MKRSLLSCSQACLLAMIFLMLTPTTTYGQLTLKYLTTFQQEELLEKAAENMDQYISRDNEIVRTFLKNNYDYSFSLSCSSRQRWKIADIRETIVPSLIFYIEWLIEDDIEFWHGEEAVEEVRLMTSVYVAALETISEDMGKCNYSYN
ncbi:MAG: hypothetical protein OXC40_05100 [Proteobacteria bacterium]|nr:hypothetical protein [Pseudomonadota bacterium]